MLTCTKQTFILYFDAGREHMATRPRGNGTNFHWLRQSCDIKACDLSPERNLEKYGRPVKSAIAMAIMLDDMTSPFEQILPIRLSICWEK